MIRFLALILLYVFSATAFSQIANVPGAGNEVIRTKKYTDVVGSPYLYTDWKSGTVIDKGGKAYPNTLIKYDAYADAVEINQDGTVMVLNNSQYNTFTLNFADDATNKVIRHTFRSGYTTIPGLSSKAYLEVLYDGSVQLLKRYDVKFVEEVVNSYGTAAQTKRFQRSEKYFVLRDDKAAEFKMNTKSFLVAIGDKQAELEKFISKEKIKLKTEADLIQIMTYYDSL